MIRLYEKIAENFLRLILQDKFWVVHIPFVRMIKYQFLEQFPVDQFSHPVLYNFYIFYLILFTFQQTYLFWSTLPYNCYQSFSRISFISLSFKLAYVPAFFATQHPSSYRQLVKPLILNVRRKIQNFLYWFKWTAYTYSYIHIHIYTGPLA